MAALLSDIGCCPVCGRNVPRLVTRDEGMPRELYACPRHGTIEYGARPISLRRWVAQFEPRLVPTSVSRVFGEAAV